MRIQAGDIVNVNHLGKVRRMIVIRTYKGTSDFMAIDSLTDDGKRIEAVLGNEAELKRIGPDVMRRVTPYTLAVSQIANVIRKA
jgi:hypothetical protein